MFLFDYMNTLPKIIAVKSSHEKALDAVLEKKELFRQACTNRNLQPRQWFFLHANAHKNSTLYDLAVVSATKKQADIIIGSKKVTPKAGLVRSKNPYVDAETIEKIYELHPDSPKILNALLNRPDLDRVLLEKILEKHNKAGPTVRAIIVNNNIDESWVMNYFMHSNLAVQKEFITRLPSIIDSKPAVTPQLVNVLSTKQVSFHAKTTLRALSCLAESRHIDSATVSMILDYLQSFDKKNMGTVVVAMSLLGNPTLEAHMAEKTYDFVNSKTNYITPQQSIRSNILINTRREFGKTYLKPGWDYEFDSNEEKLYDQLADQTYQHAVRKGIQIDRQRLKSSYEYNLPAEEAKRLRLGAAKQELTGWMWGQEAQRALWYVEHYVDQLESSHQAKVWSNIINLGGDWDGTLIDLLQASSRL